MVTKESDTERDGAFSYPAEIHAAGIGIYTGLATLKPWDDDIENRRGRYADVDKEVHYYAGGFVVGTVLQLIIILTVLSMGFF